MKVREDVGPIASLKIRARAYRKQDTELGARSWRASKSKARESQGYYRCNYATQDSERKGSESLLVPLV
eukprot:1336214-Amorphochlora_amoeboformis.AAC.1